MIINERDKSKDIHPEPDGEWMNMNGFHAKVDKDGNVVLPPDGLPSKSGKKFNKKSSRSSSGNGSKNKKQRVVKSGPSKFAQGLANAIDSSEKWIENNVINNISNMKGTGR